MNAPANPSKLIKGATGDWEIVVGMEIHAQVSSRSKLFSGASTECGGDPNSHVSLVDAAMPGMLPVINEECVKQAVRTGIGLKAQINHRSTFDRKNYFYPDLPQGYQISQYKSPIVGEGEVIVDVTASEQIVVGIDWMIISDQKLRNCWYADDSTPYQTAIAGWVDDSPWQKIGYGGWEVDPLPDGGSRVSYQMWVEAEILPASVMAWALSRTLPTLMNAFEARVASLNPR
jgi:hypothetical protein